MVSASVCIGERPVGPGLPAYVIAEAGVNHNGSVDLAHQLIDAARDADADAVKFQTFEPSALVLEGAETATYQKRQTGLDDQRAMLESLCLPVDAWPELRIHAIESGLEFLSTPFDQRSLGLLVEIGVQAVKISSGDVTNHRLIREAHATGLPVILSTGASYLEEVTRAVDSLGDVEDLILLHCVTSYPAPVEESNLLAITALADTFGCPVGWSDHSVGSATAVAAVALGASVFEKHLTLDVDLPGPDHRASADPEALGRYVAAIREAESALGDGVKRPQPAELGNRQLARRGLYAARELVADAVVAEGDFVALRPEAGVAADVAVVGQRLNRSLSMGQALQPADLRSVP